MSTEPTAHPCGSPPIDWARFVSLIGAHRRNVLTTHVRPDADAIGSELAMAAVLERAGKEVAIVNAFDIPPQLRPMAPPGKLLRLGSHEADSRVGRMDLLLVLDTAAWAQLGDMGNVIRITPAAKAVLDHHVTCDDLGAELFRDPKAEATGRLVAEAARYLGVAITPDIASPLFAAVATDTGWFRFASTTAATLRLAAELVECGAVPHALYRDLYENERPARLVLLGRAMARARTELDGRLIYTWLRQDDFAAAGALPTDSEDIINMTLSVGGTEVAVILVELAAGSTKVSFRSRSGLDSSAVALQFGGGGHKAAAGALLHEPFEAARGKVLDAVRAAMQQ